MLIGVADELRQLEYSQRLAHRARNVMAAPGQSNGRNLFTAALAGGNRALGVAEGGLKAGAPADFVALDRRHPSLAARADDALIDAWLFAAQRSAIDAVWRRGRRVVEGGRHIARDAIVDRYRRAIAALIDE